MRKKTDLTITLKDVNYFDTWTTSADGTVYRNHGWVVPTDAVKHHKPLELDYILKSQDKKVEMLTKAWNYLIPIEVLSEDSKNLVYEKYPEIFL